MQVTPEDIAVISRLVNDLCGIVLDETKGYLIESRLSDIATREGCGTFTELYCKARYDTNGPLQKSIIDAITTNETLFFRDTSPFEALQHKALPEMIDVKAATPTPKRLRIWSAACSTGQEPYSMAMVLRELLPDIDTWDISITATDISDAAIAQASLGQYAAHEIGRGMDQRLLQKYFVKNGNQWKVKDELRGLIAFSRINLLESFASLGTFDIIFCRNVAIYFENTVRKDLFNRLTKNLSKEGYLFAGSTESLADCGPQFVPQHHCRAVFYRPNLQTCVAAT